MTSGFDRLAGELRQAERQRAAAARRPHRLGGLLAPLATMAVVAAVLGVVLLTGTGPRQLPLPDSGRGTPPASSRSQAVGGWRLRCSEIVATQAPPRGIHP